MTKLNIQKQTFLMLSPLFKIKLYHFYPYTSCRFLLTALPSSQNNSMREDNEMAGPLYLQVLYLQMEPAVARNIWGKILIQEGKAGG